MASFPTAPVIFPARSDGTPIFAQHVNALQDEVSAIEAALIGGTLPAHSVTTPLKVAGLRPTVLLDYTGQPVKGRAMAFSPLGSIALLENLDYDGSNWLLDDVGVPGIVFAMNAGTASWYEAPAGANPRPLSTLFQILADGAVRERGRGVSMGEWTTPAFNAGNFGGSGGMVWTVGAGGVSTYKYSQVGKTVMMLFDVSGTISGTVGPLCSIALPVGTSLGQASAIGWNANTTNTTSLVAVANGATFLSIYKEPTLAVNYALGSCRLAGTFIYQIP
jgi:hypothetical protein